jgi:hypothetical protein
VTLSVEPTENSLNAVVAQKGRICGLKKMNPVVTKIATDHSRRTPHNATPLNARSKMPIQGGLEWHKHSLWKRLRLSAVTSLVPTVGVGLGHVPTIVLAARQSRFVSAAPPIST